jgi:hypothetical protein
MPATSEPAARDVEAAQVEAALRLSREQWIAETAAQRQCSRRAAAVADQRHAVVDLCSSSDSDMEQQQQQQQPQSTRAPAAATAVVAASGGATRDRNALTTNWRQELVTSTGVFFRRGVTPSPGRTFRPALLRDPQSWFFTLSPQKSVRISVPEGRALQITRVTLGTVLGTDKTGSDGRTVVSCKYIDASETGTLCNSHAVCVLGLGRCECSSLRISVTEERSVLLSTRGGAVHLAGFQYSTRNSSSDDESELSEDEWEQPDARCPVCRATFNKFDLTIDIRKAGLVKVAQRAARAATGTGDSDIQEELQCCMCLELLSEPVTLPCGHDGCLKCLRAVRGGGGHGV